MERARSGSVPASAAGDPAAEFARADDFMRRSRPNLGLREAPPALLEIFDLAGRVEALPGDFAHPATGDMRQDHVVRSSRGAGLALGELPGQARRQAAQAGQRVDGGEATAQLREAVRTLPCPVAGYAAPPDAGRESSVTDRELLDEIYGIVTEPADDHEDVIGRVRALMTGHGLWRATAGERGA